MPGKVPSKKRIFPQFRRLTGFVFVFLALISRSFAQDNATTANSEEDLALRQLEQFTRPEAPPALFSTKLNDASVELFLQGSWLSGIGGYLAFTESDSGLVPGTFPGFTQSPWNNTVDFLLSLWIQRHYFFEAHISDGFAINTFLLGYENPDTIGLNKVLIGNTQIDFPVYPYLGIGEGGDQVPGVLATWSTRISTHQLMVRLLNQNTVVQRFQGSRSLNSSQVDPNSFVRGRLFQLPQTNVNSVQVWVQSPGGSPASDGQNYTRLDVSQILYVDPAAGQVGLRDPPQGRVLITYKTGPDSTGVWFPRFDLSTNSDRLDLGDLVQFDSPNFDDQVLTPLAKFGLSDPEGFFVDLGTQNAIVAYSPGYFSPFEDLSWYRSPEGLSITSLLTSEGDSGGMSVRNLADLVHVSPAVAPSTGAYPDGARAQVAARYPFLAGSFGPAPRMYLPSYRKNAAEYLEWIGQTSSTNGDLVLDSDPIPESILVLRNGIPDTGFTFDPASRSLHFLVPVQDAESITVTYSTKSTVGGVRTLQIAQGNTFTFSPELALQVALGLTWPLENISDYTDSSQNTGRIDFGAMLAFTDPKSAVSADVKTGLEFSLPQTSGVLVLDSYDSAILGIELTLDHVLPASAPLAAKVVATVGQGSSSMALIPSDTAIAGGVGATDPFGVLSSALALPNSLFTPQSRGKLLYKDYHNESGTLDPVSGSPDKSFDYVPGNPTGPYLAKSDAGDPFQETIAVADFVMDQGAEDWTGMEIRMTDAQKEALRQTGTINLLIRGSGFSNKADVYLQAGALDEDLDGDSRINRGSPGASGMPFRDSFPTHSGTYVVAPGAQNTDTNQLSEDANANGILDPEHEVLSAYVGRFSAGVHESWTQLNLSVSPADRYRLADAGAIRLIIVRVVQGMPLSGRLLVARVSVDKPGFAAGFVPESVASGASVEAGVSSSISLHNSLSRQFPAAVGTSDAPAQASLRWVAGTSSTHAVAVQVFQQLSVYDFRVLRFYIQPGNLPGANLGLTVRFGQGLSAQSLPSSARDSLTASFTLPQSSSWLKLEFDTVASRATLSDPSGNVIARSRISVTGHPQLLDSMSLEWDTTGSAGTSGLFYVDSIQADNAIASFSARFAADFAWTHQGSIWDIDGFSILQNVRTTQGATVTVVRKLAQETSLDDPSDTSLAYAGTLGATIAYVDLLAGLNLNADKSALGAQGSYEITAPSGVASPVVLKDSYASDLNTGTFVQKNSSLALNIDRALGFKADVAVDRTQDLTQTWSAAAQFGSGDPLLFSADSQISQNSIEGSPSWRSLTFFPRLEQAFSWYLPEAESLRIERDFTLDLGGKLSLKNFGVDLKGSFLTSQRPGATLPFSDTLNLGSVFSFGSPDSGLLFQLSYGRVTTLNEAFRSRSLGDELNRGLDNWGRLKLSWLSAPVYELFAPAETFASQSSPWSDVVQTPNILVSMARGVDTGWTSILVPQKASLGFARALSRKGFQIQDDFLAYSTLDWTVLNLFGRVGAYPRFPFYETEQVGSELRFGVMNSEGIPVLWNVGYTINLALFGFGKADNSDWHSRLEDTTGLVSIMPPDQLQLTDAFDVRDGQSGLVGNAVGLNLSWQVPLPNLALDFLKRPGKGATFLESIESLSVGLAYPWAEDLAVLPGTEFAGIYSFSPSDQIPDVSGWLVTVSHKSYLIFPGAAYASAQIDLGYEYDKVTKRASIAVRLYVEAKISY